MISVTHLHTRDATHSLTSEGKSRLMNGTNARRRYIRVRVEPGMFSSERYVMFDAGDQSYGLFVDERDVHDNLIPVYVVAEHGDQAIVDLPRETWTTGNRIQVPTEILEADGVRG